MTSFLDACGLWNTIMLIFSSYCIYLTCYVQLYQFQKQWGEEKALLYSESKLFSTFEKNLMFFRGKKKKAKEKPWHFELFWNSPCCSRNVAQELLKLLWKPVKSWCRCLGLKRIQSSWQEIIVSTCIQLDLGEFELMWSQRSGREWNMVKWMALMEQDLREYCSLFLSLHFCWSVSTEIFDCLFFHFLSAAWSNSVHRNFSNPFCFACWLSFSNVRATR